MIACKKEMINLPEITSNVKVWIVGILLVVGIINYFLLARKRKYLEIIEEFNNETKKQSERGMILVLLYMFISLGMPIYIFLFTMPN